MGQKIPIYELVNQAGENGVHFFRQWLEDKLKEAPYPEDFKGVHLAYFVRKSDGEIYFPDLSGLDYSGHDFSWATFGDKLQNTNFNSCILRRSVLYNTDLTGSSLDNADLSYANIQGANMSFCQMKNTLLDHALCNRVNLSNTDLRKASMKNTDFALATLDYTDLSGANLRGANLRNVDLCTTKLIGSDLRDAKLSGTIFRDYVFSANIKKARFNQPLEIFENDLHLVNSLISFASAEGIESASFEDPSFLNDLLTRAFEYLHKQNIPERDKWPEFINSATQKLKALNKLYDSPEPPNSLIVVAQTISTELIEFLKNHPKELYNLRPRQFEELIAEILTSYNWKVELTTATKDGGYDIFAISTDISGLRSSWVIECKKYREDRKVGIDIARSIYGVKSDLHIANAMLATTSFFTKGVHDFKASRYDFELRDYQGITEWLEQVAAKKT